MAVVKLVEDSKDAKHVQGHIQRNLALGWINLSKILNKLSFSIEKLGEKLLVQGLNWTRARKFNDETNIKDDH